jgi:hypothetical protein
MGINFKLPPITGNKIQEFNGIHKYLFFSLHIALFCTSASWNISGKGFLCREWEKIILSCQKNIKTSEL